jgi:hypothetical protein
MEQYSSNLPKLSQRVVNLNPTLGDREGAFRDFCVRLAKELRTTNVAQKCRALEEARARIQRTGGITPTKRDVALRFACSVVVDVVAQGWEISVRRRCVELRLRSAEGVSSTELKQRIREGHLLERDAQLREPAVREFVRGMEQRRLSSNGWVSIFSLMRDGRELADKLQAAASQDDHDDRIDQLRSAISPYLQLVESEQVCEFTGIRLIDIWRYFRHTWVNSYKSLPGRSMMLLVRDAAAPLHPVIGIAALGSSMAQQTLRDEWIGWDSKVFVDKLLEKPTARLSRWIFNSIERLIKGIYVSDLLNDTVIKRSEIKRPTRAAIDRLLADSQRAGKQHRLYPDAANHKANASGSVSRPTDWKKQATTPLFRAKRSRTLARLLSIRARLQGTGFDETSPESLKLSLEKAETINALRQLVRLVKAEHVGIDMMDIVICGAIPPYNLLLGGKLVCSLLSSPEVVRSYRKRYGRHVSIIASSMSGKPVVRVPNLVLLATTSLYGVGSSQYNRVRVPLSEISDAVSGRLEYVELGISKGYGSYHFSRASIEYLETLLGRAGNGRKVNSIFGEGVNPLMRKIREGLDEVGLPSDELLMHGNQRLVYGVPLARNFREILLGLCRRPDYYLCLTKAKNHSWQLADYWRRRWLASRITRPGILSQVAEHILTYPVVHGARVQLPDDGQRQLFDSALVRTQR